MNKAEVIVFVVSDDARVVPRKRFHGLASAPGWHGMTLDVPRTIWNMQVAGPTPLYIASARGHTAAVDLLLQAGGDHSLQNVSARQDLRCDPSVLQVGSDTCVKTTPFLERAPAVVSLPPPPPIKNK